MADKLSLEIVTPKGRVLSATVDEVTVPSVDGEFGVLPGHLPIVAVLRTGLVTYRTGAESKTCAVGPGFAEAGQDKVILLTDEYAQKDGIDPVLLRKDLNAVQKDLEKNLAQTLDTPEIETERKALIEKENWLAAQLELYGDAPPATMRPFEEWGPPPDPIVEEEDKHGAGSP